MSDIVRNNRGIALLLTISVTTILVAAALEYNRQARATLVSTATMRNSITLSQMTASGIHVAMAMLLKDKSESTTDSLLEDWANAEKIEALLAEIPFEDGELTVKITDEMGKIQVNALVAYPDKNAFNEPQLNLWERFLNQVRDEDQMQEDSEPVAIINSVKDWLDSGDDEAITGLSGAESDYYKDLDPPYACRNGPIPDLDELLLIKGITPELYHGNEETPGLSQSMTIHGVAGSGFAFNFPGRININTADFPVLMALIPLEDEDLIKALVDYRNKAIEDKESPDFSNPGWYKDIPGLGDITLNTKLVTISSDIFRIEAQAKLRDTRQKTIAVVQRAQRPKTGKWSCKVLSWETD